MAAAAAVVALGPAADPSVVYNSLLQAANDPQTEPFVKKGGVASILPASRAPLLAALLKASLDILALLEDAAARRRLAMVVVGASKLDGALAGLDEGD